MRDEQLDLIHDLTTAEAPACTKCGPSSYGALVNTARRNQYPRMLYQSYRARFRSSEVRMPVASHSHSPSCWTPLRARPLRVTQPMKRPRPSSEPRAGLFVTVDGPSGVGKTTTIAHLAQLLRADNRPVHLTAEPSRGPIGRLAYDLTDTVTGPALACLYAADRYHHLQTEIRPHLDVGHLVLCDRYVSSALVMQRLDGLEFDFLWNLNLLADRPDLSIILTADPDLIAARLAARGPHNRLQRQDDSTTTEVRFYRDAHKRLDEAGYRTVRIDTGEQPARAAAIWIRQAIRRRYEQAADRPLPGARERAVGTQNHSQR